MGFMELNFNWSKKDTSNRIKDSPNLFMIRRFKVHQVNHKEVGEVSIMLYIYLYCRSISLSIMKPKESTFVRLVTLS